MAAPRVGPQNAQQPRSARAVPVPRLRTGPAVQSKATAVKAVPAGRTQQNTPARMVPKALPVGPTPAAQLPQVGARVKRQTTPGADAPTRTTIARSRAAKARAAERAATADARVLGKASEQVSFKDGELVRYGARGSARVDLLQKGTATEVKNYNESNRGALIRSVRRSGEKQRAHLPPSVGRALEVDARSWSPAGVAGLQRDLASSPYGSVFIRTNTSGPSRRLGRVAVKNALRPR